MIRVLIADDHTIVREGLKRIIAETADMTVADEAASGDEALQKAFSTPCDVMLLDISMPGLSGMEVLRQLKKREEPKPRAIVLSVSPEEQFAAHALREGAHGYLTKESLPAELVAAIRKVAIGRKYISETFAERLAEDPASSRQAPHETLSEREYCVMHMLASGKTVSEVAQDLRISVKTVSTYRSRVLEKMRMRNNADLVRYALQNGLV